MTAKTATIHQLASASCPKRCRFAAGSRQHHDRLLLIDHDHEALMDLMEIAVTYGELDYSHIGIVEPEGWLDFAQAHRWQDAERANRVLAIAFDVAMSSVRSARTAPALDVRRSALAR